MRGDRKETGGERGRKERERKRLASSFLEIKIGTINAQPTNSGLLQVREIRKFREKAGILK